MAIALFIFLSMSLCADEPYYIDEYYPKPGVIEFEGHLWEPYMLMHSSQCPCHEEKPDLLLDN